jgi:hypothetical protein
VRCTNKPFIGFKRAFHDGDLEPSGLMHYFELQLLLQGMLKTAHAGPTDWIVFIAEMLDWLDTRADHSDYAQEGAAPWPHRYVATDAVEAFAIIAMFFPELEVTSLVTMFLKAPHCKRFRTSDLFKPLERSKTRPDRRSRTSYKFREPQFWSEWEQIMNKKESFRDIYPFDWSLCVRPIIAHCTCLSIKPGILPILTWPQCIEQESLRPLTWRPAPSL